MVAWPDARCLPRSSRNCRANRSSAMAGAPLKPSEECAVPRRRLGRAPGYVIEVRTIGYPYESAQRSKCVGMNPGVLDPDVSPWRIHCDPVGWPAATAVHRFAFLCVGPAV